MFYTNYVEPEGGVHRVSRDTLITAHKKARYRDALVNKVNRRLMNTMVESGWWIFKFKRSQMQVVVDHIRGHISAVWDTALTLGFISEHERDVLKRGALTSVEIEAMLLASENSLSTTEMKKLVVTLDIKEEV